MAKKAVADGSEIGTKSPSNAYPRRALIGGGLAESRRGHAHG